MSAYFQAVGKTMKDWKNAVLVVVLTVVRLVFGWAWFFAGWEKLGWIGASTPQSAGLIHGMINNLAGPKVERFDPLNLNSLFAWVAQNVFLSMPQVTDVLVVVFELGVGILFILGFRVFWSALAATFLNLQYITAGSFNNFGYIWTDLAFLKFAQAAEVIGLDGILRFRRGKELIRTNSV